MNKYFKKLLLIVFVSMLFIPLKASALEYDSSLDPVLDVEVNQAGTVTWTRSLSAAEVFIKEDGSASYNDPLIYKEVDEDDDMPSVHLINLINEKCPSATYGCANGTTGAYQLLIREKNEEATTFRETEITVQFADNKLYRVHHVKFYDGSTVIDSQLVKHGHTVQRPDNSVLIKGLYSSYDFYRDPDFTERFNYSYDSITEDTNVYVKFRANFWVDVVLEDGNSSSNYGFVESTDGNSMWDAGTAASADMDAEMEIRAVPRPGFNFVEWRAATNLNRVDFENAETYSTDQTITIHFTGNMTVYAVFEQDETARFTVTLDPNNEINQTATIPGFTYAQEWIIEDPSTYNFATPAGSEFVGWRIKGELYNPKDTYIIREDIIAQAVWRSDDTPKYTVAFEPNNGTTIDDAIVAEGEKVTRPTDPIMAGFTFDKWYKDDMYTQEYDFNEPVTEDLILYARYHTNLWYRTYNLDTGEVEEGIGAIEDDWGNQYEDAVATSIYQFEERFLRPVPAAGYDFVEWRIGASDEVIAYTYDQLPTYSTETSISLIPSGNTTVIAVFKKASSVIKEANVWVTYPTIGEAPSDEVFSDFETRYNARVVSWNILGEDYDPENPILYFVKDLTYELRVEFTPEEGYTFADDCVFTINGQATSRYGANNQVQVYWQATHSGEPEYEITFDFNGGTRDGRTTETYNWVAFGYVLSPESLLDGVEIPEGKALDYVLVNNERHDLDTDLMINQDYYIEYIWKDAPTEPLTVTFKVDGVTYETKEVAYGELVEEPETPEKSGFIFSSWEDSEWGMPFEFTQKIYKDITLTATWLEAGDPVYVYFETGYGPGMDTITATVGDTIDAPVAPENENYRFDGYYSDYNYRNAYDFSKPITHDVTIFVKYTRMLHEIVFNLDEPNDYSTPETLFMENPNDELYDVMTLSWYDETKGTELGYTEEFIYGHVYTNEFEFYPRDGYEFADDAVIIINGEEYPVDGPLSSVLEVRYTAGGEGYHRVNFDYNGGTASSIRDYTRFVGETVTFDYDLIMDYVIAPAGKLFDYAEMNGERITLGSPVTLGYENTLKYYWKDQKPKYTIKYDYNGGKKNGKATETVVTENTWFPLDKSNFVSGLTKPANKDLDYLLINGKRENFGAQYTLTSGTTSVKYMWIDINLNSTRVSYGSTNTITLSWNKVRDAAGYYVYQSTNNKTWKKVATTTALTYTAKKLTANKKYYYRVEAYRSNKVVFTKSPVLTTKTAPKTSKLKVKKSTYNTVTLTVTKVTGAKKYIIEKSTDNKTFTTAKVVTKAGNVLVGGLNTGTKYYYRVRACNEYNNCNAYSKVVNKVPELKKPTIKVSSKAKTQMTVKVPLVDGAAGYVIERSLAKSKGYVLVKDVKDARAYLDTNLLSKKKYYYRVRAYRIVNGKKVFSAYSKVANAKVK